MSASRVMFMSLVGLSDPAVVSSVIANVVASTPAAADADANGADLGIPGFLTRQEENTDGAGAAPADKVSDTNNAVQLEALDTEGAQPDDSDETTTDDPSKELDKIAEDAKNTSDEEETTDAPEEDDTTAAPDGEADSTDAAGTDAEADNLDTDEYLALLQNDGEGHDADEHMDLAEEEHMGEHDDEQGDEHDDEHDDEHEEEHDEGDGGFPDEDVESAEGHDADELSLLQTDDYLPDEDGAEENAEDDMSFGDMSWDGHDDAHASLLETGHDDMLDHDFQDLDQGADHLLDTDYDDIPDEHSMQDPAQMNAQILDVARKHNLDLTNPAHHADAVSFVQTLNAIEATHAQHRREIAEWESMLQEMADTEKSVDADDALDEQQPDDDSSNDDDETTDAPEEDDETTDAPEEDDETTDAPEDSNDANDDKNATKDSQDLLEVKANQPSDDSSNDDETTDAPEDDSETTEDPSNDEDQKTIDELDATDATSTESASADAADSA